MEIPMIKQNIGEMIMDRESFHEFLIKHAKQIVSQMDHAPLFFMIVKDEMLIFDVSRFMASEEGKEQLEGFLLTAISTIKPRMAAHVMECRYYEKDSDKKTDGLAVVVEDPLGSELWLYEIRNKKLGNEKHFPHNATGKFANLLKRAYEKA